MHNSNRFSTKHFYKWASGWYCWANMLLAQCLEFSPSVQSFFSFIITSRVEKKSYICQWLSWALTCPFFPLQNFILKRFSTLMDNQTWKEEKEERVSKQELRSTLLETACALNVPKCTQQAKALFKQYIESNGTNRYKRHTIKKSMCVCVCEF